MPVIEFTIKCIYGLKHRTSTNEYVYLRPHQKYARERALIWQSVLLLCSSAEKQKSLQGCNFPRKEGSRRQEERKERSQENFLATLYHRQNLSATQEASQAIFPQPSPILKTPHNCHRFAFGQVLLSCTSTSQRHFKRDQKAWKR